MRNKQQKLASPEPKRRFVPGSGVLTGGKGVGVPPPGGTVKPPPKPALVPPVPVLPPSRLVQPIEKVLVSMVTAPVWAKARPHWSVAPVSSVMLVNARRVPSNDVVVSSVAELPTFQYRPAPAPVLITLTIDPGEVISVLGIWNTQKALRLPLPSSVRVPVKLLVPAGTV
jgi:hypothetical protein